MSKDNTELEEQLDRRRVSFGLWKIVSDMLDNPGEHGIYPTSECYDRLDEKAQALITEAEKKQLTWAKYYAKNWLHDCCEATHLTMIDEIDKRLTQLKGNK